MRDEDDKGQHFWHDSCSRGSRVSPTKVSPFQARIKLRFLGGTTDREHVFFYAAIFFKKSSHFLAIKKRERA